MLSEKSVLGFEGEWIWEVASSFCFAVPSSVSSSSISSKCLKVDSEGAADDMRGTGRLYHSSGTQKLNVRVAD